METTEDHPATVMYCVNFLRKLEGWDKERRYILGRMILELIVPIVGPLLTAAHKHDDLEALRAHFGENFVRADWGECQYDQLPVPTAPDSLTGKVRQHFEENIKEIFSGESGKVLFRSSRGHIEK